MFDRALLRVVTVRRLDKAFTEQARLFSKAPKVVMVASVSIWWMLEAEFRSTFSEESAT